MSQEEKFKSYSRSNVISFNQKKCSLHTKKCGSLKNSSEENFYVLNTSNNDVRLVSQYTILPK